MKHHILVRSFDLLFAFGSDLIRKKEISEIFMDKYELLNKKSKRLNIKTKRTPLVEVLLVYKLWYE